jgi:predicted PolB exonuclease-like 3'-5' exonuclease
MGLNNENAMRLVFDIETAPLTDAAVYIEPADAPANYKDPVKIAAAIAEKNAEALSKCGLDVDLCRVVAIGWQREDEDAPKADMARDDENEAQILADFWRTVGDRHIVGFNCLAFDLPVLLRRSLYLGVRAPRLQIDRFKHPHVTDLSDELSYGGKLRLRSLSFYCKRFGISVPDTMTGADIGQAVAEGRWDDVRAHVVADIKKTAALANKLGFFSQPALAVF